MTSIIGAVGDEHFEKRVRPLLIQHCYKCHGESKQKADLRVDSKAALLAGGESGTALVPNDPDKSLLIKVVKYAGDTKMPPSGKLSDQEIADLTHWVKSGAPWPGSSSPAPVKPETQIDWKKRGEFWSLQPLSNPTIPLNENSNWASNPIDQFILKSLQDNQLQPAERADRQTLIRRVYLDLLGQLPPPEAVQEFVDNVQPDAYEQLVDRLLSSPAYGERWARHWLDLARYADTMGHEFDFEIFQAWRYRDYVIRALNEDLPYDDFVREQIAGDLLPMPRFQAGLNQSVQGTMFWLLGEGKHSPVDVKAEQADRIDNQIDVFSKTFFGLTVSCARCHDHKFDAIKARDYYALYGILSSSRQTKVYLEPLAIPQVVLLENQLKKLGELETERISNHLQTSLINDAKWTEILSKNDFIKLFRAIAQAPIAQRPTLAKNLREQQTNVEPDPSTPWLFHGQAFALPAVGAAKLTSPHAWLGPVNRLPGAAQSKTFVIKDKWLLLQVAGRNLTTKIVMEGFQLIQNPIYGSLKFNINHPEPAWHAIDMSMWQGRRVYVEVLAQGNGHGGVISVAQRPDRNPPPVQMPTKLINLLGNSDQADFTTKVRTTVLEIVQSWAKNGQLSTEEVKLIESLLHFTIPLPKPSEAELAAIQEINRLQQTIPTPEQGIALTDGPGLDEYVFIRGNHRNEGPTAPRQFLDCFGGSPTAGGSGRLELAEKITRTPNPLLLRVIVNRLWHHHFGQGIVRTPDDFGVQGQPPTHPELLDWLAAELVRGNWSLKKMHRLMLTSSTYQQSSQTDPKSDEKDPKNMWWHRTNVRRMEAEVIRDTVFQLSGNLSQNMGGPGIAPHLTPFMIGRGRPAGGPLDGHGRKSIYLQVRRNFLNPMMLAFDAPQPFTAIGKRSISYVPAQALALMNNPMVEQQTRKWAAHLLEKYPDADERISRIYLQSLGRKPSVDERNLIMSYLQHEQELNPKLGQDALWGMITHMMVNTKEFIFIR
ncbi:MAG: PSD1 and planctomycete cytochrome C domain-containing protein [Zavarzinella sp.]